MGNFNNFVQNERDIFAESWQGYLGFRARRASEIRSCRWGIVQNLADHLLPFVAAQTPESPPIRPHLTKRPAHF
jgi:hypothetical protein